MPSTITRPVAARVPNRVADDLALVASASGRTVGRVIGDAVETSLAELRSQSRQHGGSTGS